MRLVEGGARTSIETTDVAFFARGEFPENMTAFQRALAEHAFADSGEPTFQ